MSLGTLWSFPSYLWLFFLQLTLPGMITRTPSFLALTLHIPVFTSLLPLKQLAALWLRDTGVWGLVLAGNPGHPARQAMINFILIHFSYEETETKQGPR